MHPSSEDHRNEFKSRPSGLSREIAAFANAQGGRIYIGLNDDGSKSDLRIDNKVRSAIIDEIENCEPRPSFELIESEGLLILEIHEGRDKPYRAPKGFFLRIGASSRKLKRDEILKFAMDENRVQFDSQIRSEIFTLNDSTSFSPSLFGAFRERSRLQTEMNDMALLENLGLIKYEGGTAHPTNALILLFSREASSVFPQARLVIWEMGDPTTITDQRVITGSLFNQLYQGLAIVQSKLRQNYQIEGLTRTSTPEFPETVLRELVVNALVHRDYFERGAEIQIKIFPDTIEISNPGKPLYDTKPQQLLGRSLRRNPLLAEVLHRAGLVERAGTGLIRVNQLLAEHRRLPVTLTTEGEFFIATLSRQIPDDKSLGLSHRQNSILKTLSKGRKISTSEYANLYKISTRQARKDLAELISRKLVLQEKVGRNTFYVASHTQRKS